jgi:hypothetical protein
LPFHGLFQGLLRPGAVFVAGVTHNARKGADEEDDMVPQVLELAQLAHGHGVAQVQVGRGGVVAAVHPQGPPRLAAFLQPLAQLRLHVFVGLGVTEIDAPHEDGQLFFDGRE